MLNDADVTSLHLNTYKAKSFMSVRCFQLRQAREARSPESSRPPSLLGKGGKATRKGSPQDNTQGVQPALGDDSDDGCQQLTTGHSG